MKILQLCKKFPYPLKDGESIANTYISKSLRDLGCEISLLAMNTTKHYVDISKLPEDFDHFKNIYHVELDNQVSYIDAFKYLFKPDSYQVARFVNSNFEKKLTSILQQEKFDVVQIESIYLTSYIPTIRKHSDALVAMRAHNIENEIWGRMASNLPFGLKKWYFNHLTKRLRKFEEKQWKQYDLLITLTKRDLDTYRGMGYYNGAIMSPIGLNLKNYDPNYQNEQQLDLAYIGALDWLPNQEGLLWFINEVMPKLTNKFPNVKLHVAGRNTPEDIFGLQTDKVIIHGEVSDALKFIRENPILVVPLFSGSGMRVKILEGMALGKVVITTTLGLEGIHATHDREVLVADSPEDFVTQISKCFNNPSLIEQIGMNAKSFIDYNFDNQDIAKELYNKYAEEIPKHKPHSQIV